MPTHDPGRDEKGDAGPPGIAPERTSKPGRISPPLMGLGGEGIEGIDRW
jgi:hypothetical protein